MSIPEGMINSDQTDSGPGGSSVAEQQSPPTTKDPSFCLKVIKIIESIGMGVCIGYAAICWGTDLYPNTFHLDQMHPGTRANMLSPAGLVTTCVGLVLSFVAFRRRRLLSILTWFACVLWTVWALLPRL